MPIDPNEAIQIMERSLGMIPGVVIVVALLAGPTFLWLLYRFVVQPRTSRYAGGEGGLLWVCADCRSANDVRSGSCYACGLEREEIDQLQVFDGERLVTLTDGDSPIVTHPPAPAVPVMAPTMTTLATPPTPSAQGIQAGQAAEAVQPHDVLVVPTAARPRRLVAVGPGRQPAKAASPTATSNGPSSTGAKPRSTTKRARTAAASESGQGVAIAESIPETGGESLDTPTVEA